MALSAKKRKAIDGYLSGKDKTTAMKDAGYARTTAETKHSAIFGDPAVVAEIERRQKIASTRSDVTLEWIVDRLKSLADANLGDLVDVDPEGNVSINYTKLTPNLRRALNNFTVDEITEGRGENARKVKRVRVGITDQIRALELLVKHLGLSKEKIVVSVEEDLVSRLHRGRQRAGLEESA